MPSKKSGRKTKAVASRKPEVAEKKEKIYFEDASTSLLERKRENDNEVIKRVREMKNQLFPSNNGPGERESTAPSPTINLITNPSMDQVETPKLFQQAKEAGNELTEAFKRIADQYN
ncbi:unnamed protein product, partial [Mesorhabditis belari]|uniref:Uncharacterized protein n=1 Tax=Mesorhabditis belari TaxID=2138241 RepID=A0AAF3FQT2_9BILA